MLNLAIDSEKVKQNPKLKAQMQRLLEHVRIRRADRNWCVEFVATMNKHVEIPCAILAKDYVPPTAKLEKEEVKQSAVDHNRDDFYTGLPQPSDKQIQRARLGGGLSKEQKLQQQIANLDKRMSQLKNKQTHLKKEVEAYKDAPELGHVRIPLSRYTEMQANEALLLSRQAVPPQAKQVVPTLISRETSATAKQTTRRN